MEEAIEIETEQHSDKTWVFMAKALPLGAVGALVALGSSGPLPAAGAFAGAMAAGLYAVGYVKGHLSGAAERDRVFDSRVARGAMLRILAMAAGGAAAYAAGRSVLIAYLASFAVSFAVLLGSQVPQIKRQLSAGGDSRGPGDAEKLQTTKVGVI